MQIFKHKHPKDHISTAVVYSVSYGPDKVMCIDTCVYMYIIWIYS